MTFSRGTLLVVLTAAQVFSGTPMMVFADDSPTPGAPRDWDGLITWLETNPQSPDFSDVLLRAVDRAPSLRALQEVVGKYYADVDTREHRASLARTVGSTLEMGNRYSSAADWYQRALEEQEDDQTTQLRLAGVQLELGAIHEAIDNLTEVVQRAPDRHLQRSAALLRARAYMLLERLEEAREQTLSLAGGPDFGAEPATLYLLLEIARTMQDQDLYEAVINRLQTAYQDAPETALASRDLAPGTESPRVVPFPTPSRIFGRSRIAEEIASRAQPQPQQPDATTPVAGIQTGSFRDPENAQYMVKDIEALGFSALVRTVETETGTFYRVIIPVRDDQDDPGTQEVIVRLKDQGIEGFLVFHRE